MTAIHGYGPGWACPACHPGETFGPPPGNSPREFPILRYWSERAPGQRASVPWELVAPHADQARRNHDGQSLEELARRGGLGPSELVAVLCDRRWQRMDPAAADAALEDLVAAYLRADPGREDGS